MSEVKVCPTCGTEYPLSERFCPRDGTALRSNNPQGDLVGSVVHEKFHVMKKLGEGGMGAVYLAEHVKMGRKVALKVMNPGMHQDPDAIARLRRGADAMTNRATGLKKLADAGLVRWSDIGRLPGAGGGRAAVSEQLI